MNVTLATADPNFFTRRDRGKRGGGGEGSVTKGATLWVSFKVNILDNVLSIFMLYIYKKMYKCNNQTNV